MAEYYVVRDKNTGLFFRGKGVNRWGKYYNQASIYRIKANAESTIKEVSWRGEQAEVVPIQIVETATDVVEVVRCKDCKHATFYGCKNDACYKSIICEYKIGIGDENFYCACAEPRTKERGGESDG